MSAMTEDKAKTKACCAGLGLGSHNQADLPQFSACIGSRCMAWRKGDQMWQTEEGRLVDPRDGLRGDLGGRYVWLGFCGLAGKP